MEQTKKQLINTMANTLRESGMEVIITNFPNLRQPNRGLHGYCMRYDAEKNVPMIYPWAGAKDGWEIPIKRISKKELSVLSDFVWFCSEF